MPSLFKTAQAIIVCFLISASYISTANAWQKLSLDQTKAVDKVNTIFIAAHNRSSSLQPLSACYFIETEPG
jgi:hypothetical protein